MRALVLACLAVVACDDAVAIEIRIPPGIDADRVELFLGKTPCFVGTDVPCPGVGPPGSETPLPGEVFEVDSTEQFFVDVPDGADTVEFRLEGDTVIPKVIAIATGPQTAAVAILQDIDLGAGATRYVAVLEEASHGLTPEKVPSRNGFLLWPPERDPYTCAGVQFQGSRVFVVPTDYDCDQLVDDGECNRFVNNAVGPRDVPAEETTCVTLRPPIGLTEPHCMLGGPICDEPNGNTMDGCDNRRDICTSVAVCACADAGFPNLACIESKLEASNPSQANRILCSAALQPDPANPEFVSCNPGTEDLAVLPTTATDCGALIAPLLAPAQLGGSVKIENPPLEFKIIAAMQGCSFGLTWEGMLPEPGQEIPTFRGVALLDVGPRQVLLPLEVHFTTDVCRPDACIVTNDAADNVLDCFDIN